MIKPSDLEIIDSIFENTTGWEVIKSHFIDENTCEVVMRIPFSDYREYSGIIFPGYRPIGVKKSWKIECYYLGGKETILSQLKLINHKKTLLSHLQVCVSENWFGDIIYYSESETSSVFYPGRSKVNHPLSGITFDSLWDMLTSIESEVINILSHPL